ncbi:MAG: response regulator [Vicinamibacterales bacterium]
MPPAVVGDPDRVRQVLTNVVGNAVKFTAHGEVVVTLDARPAAETPSKTVVVVSVRDTGVGIPAALLPRVFEAFQQGDVSLTRQHGGTGLGLAIARRLVERMGGGITVTSTPGKGSEFVFTLSVGRAAVPAAASGRWLEGVRVLVVDDHPVTRDVLAGHVREWGGLVEVAADGDEARERLRTAVAPYEIVLLDDRMPGLDGLAAAVAFRDDPRHRQARIVMLTSGSGDAGRAFVAHDVDRSLRKPVRPAELRDCLSGLLTPGATTAPPAPQPAGRSQFAGLVLVVEDNEVNQQVATAMLRRMGCEVDVAANGREGLTMLERSRYDLVFMDCHMPVMDGFAATAAIRAQELRHGRTRQPIVALTADALAGDSDRCLSSGMDDYLSKPFGLSDLRAVLERWLPRRPAAALQAVSSGRESRPSA